ncbi:MAG: stage III sporulation protein AD [Lachnospiraceae bacterium]|nr:stage III sporulation protein AD [Lachnospiraceae bacterium]
MSIIQISIMGIITVLLSLQFKNTKSEYATLIVLAVSVLIFGFGISKLREIVSVINDIKSEFGVSNGYLEVMVKIVGISYICEFSSDICKDSGMSALGNQIQIFGKLSILVVGMPVFVQLLDTLSGLL